MARRLTEGQFAALVDGPLTRRSMTGARAATLGAAVLLLAGVLALAVVGVWLLLSGRGVLAAGLGLLLLGVAFVLRPRLGRLATHLEDARELDRASAPELFGLVERVAAEVGAPLPQVLLIGYKFNAYTSVVGLRRRRILYLGLPLWATLEPPERVALIGHELGHFVNGDVRRGPLTAMAENTLGQLAVLFAPSYAGVRGLSAMVSYAVSWVISRAVQTLQLVLYSTSQRDSQRAEYLADELAARAGGSAAAIRLTDHLLLHSALDMVLQREARAGNGMPAWRTAAAATRESHTVYAQPLRKLSRRTHVSLFASHPPAGLRAEMLEHRPQHPAAVTLDEATAARIDAEFGAFPERVRRVLADGGPKPARRRFHL
jgi:Zn-dependent protease with chaperone function